MSEEKKCIKSEELCEGKKALSQEDLEQVNGGQVEESVILAHAGKAKAEAEKMKKLTKQWVIDNLVACVEDELFIDPDRELYHELSIYERRADNSLGNIPGANNHDDVVMSLAIGLWVSVYDVEPCDWMKLSKKKAETDGKKILNEATF